MPAFPEETYPAFDESTYRLGNLLIAPRVRTVCASVTTVVPFKGVAIIKQSACRSRIV